MVDMAEFSICLNSTLLAEPRATVESIARNGSRKAISGDIKPAGCIQTLDT
jgi:hypothetical protein